MPWFMHHDAPDTLGRTKQKLSFICSCNKNTSVNFNLDISSEEHMEVHTFLAVVLLSTTGMLSTGAGSFGFLNGVSSSTKQSVTRGADESTEALMNALLSGKRLTAISLAGGKNECGRCLVPSCT